MDKMKLTGFRVRKFRSVEDSGWIDIDNVTALIGTNESGKTNLLMPLWKLNPAKDGEINSMADYPRKYYGDIRAMKQKPVFIEARFELPDELADQIAAQTNLTRQDVQSVIVKRNFDGVYYTEFPEAHVKRTTAKTTISELFTDTYKEINDLKSLKAEEGLKDSILAILTTIQEQLSTSLPDLNAQTLQEIEKQLDEVNIGSSPKTSTITPRFLQLKENLSEEISSISKLLPNEHESVHQLIINNLPSFVYYSNYGNLDSEIYLPHVIDDMKRGDLGSKAEAKARTLKVLFGFVKLEPEEILTLGKDHDPNAGVPTEEMIKTIGERKKEREILLQSASTSLTDKFRTWWKQGDYRFRFDADGNHFRIWVSDDKRPEEIELEGRSTGLQWFLSFYLIFLVESTAAHKGAVLLLDEPGLSLHPLAQENLSVFFENLSDENQLLYTTHSPFLVDPDHLDRVKAVYIDSHGTTIVSANLRAGEADSAQTKSIYPVHAALGLSVSLMLMQGCQAVIVEGTSDQIYMSIIKTYLLSKGSITPKRELLFVPAGGVKGVAAVAPILTAKSESLPYVILDSDKSGRDMYDKLKTSLYQGQNHRMVKIDDVCGLENAEVEDLFPKSLFAEIVTRYFPRQDEEFSDEVDTDKPIVPQIEEYAKNHNITLNKGWKVDVATALKARFIKAKNPMEKYAENVEVWQRLFSKITS